MAVEPYKIEIICSRCEGTGEITLDGSPAPCPDCEGDGKLGEGIVEGAEQIASLETAIAAVFTEQEKTYLRNKVDAIWEKLNE